MYTFTAEEVAALRAGPTQELDSEQLWAAHGGWAMTVVLRLLRLFPGLRIEAEDLRGAAFIALRAAANTWRPDGGAKFTSYSAPIIRFRIMDAIRALYRDNGCPRPKDYTTPRPLAWGISRNQTEEEAGGAIFDLKGNSARRLMAEMSEQFVEDRIGNIDLYTLQPDEVVDFGRRLKLFTDRLLAYAQHPHKGKRTIASRMVAAMFDEKTLEEIAEEQGVSRAAVGHSLCTARLYLQDMLGLRRETEPSKAARLPKQRQNWGRNKTRAANRKRNVCSARTSRRRKSKLSASATPKT